jgi:threonine dehydratase
VAITTLKDIRAAAERIAPYIVRTPLLPLYTHGGPHNVFLKLENLQPIGAFKVRCMANAMLTADKDALRHGVYTASSGNAGLGLAWMAKKLDTPARVYVPDNAPQDKVEKMRRSGADIILMPLDDWWQVILSVAAALFAVFRRLYEHSNPAYKSSSRKVMQLHL